MGLKKTIIEHNTSFCYINAMQEINHKTIIPVLWVLLLLFITLSTSLTSAFILITHLPAR